MKWYSHRCPCGTLICALTEENLERAIKRHWCRRSKPVEATVQELCPACGAPMENQIVYGADTRTLNIINGTLRRKICTKRQTTGCK
jgi:hypothetical protein